MACSSGGRPARRRVDLHFTNRKNAPLLFSTRLGIRPGLELSGSPTTIDKQFNEVVIRVPEEHARSHRTRALSHDLASRLSDCIPGVTEHFLADDEAEMNAMMVPRVGVDRHVRLSLERQLLTSGAGREENDFIGFQSRCHRLAVSSFSPADLDFFSHYDHHEILANLHRS
jgi:hypothetical protein